MHTCTSKKCLLALSSTALKFFKRCSLQRLKLFSVVAYSVKKSLTLYPSALKSTNLRFSDINHPTVGLFGLVPKSPTHTGLICVKTMEPNISSLGPFFIYSMVKHPEAYARVLDAYSQ
jgi:hypothetical protein